MTLPKDRQELLTDIASDLKAIDHVAAIVLGGSFATGQATDTSDLDIGIYYFDQQPFDIGAIRALAAKYDVTGAPTVTGFYEWGAWVNGGAWIKTARGKVDFLYRNIDQVRSTIDNARDGRWVNDFEQQPPYGFSSVIYLAETACCIPLYDPGKVVAALKAEVSTYPKKLKATIVQHSLWSAEFTIAHAVYFAEKQELYNVAGCLTRAVHNIVTALFAINELYQLGDKRAINILAEAGIKPKDFKEKIEMILGAGDAGGSVRQLRNLFNETRELAGGLYHPFYNFT